LLINFYRNITSKRPKLSIHRTFTLWKSYAGNMREIKAESNIK